MDFEDTPTEAAFRAEVRDWLNANAQRRSAGTRQEAPLDEKKKLILAKAFQLKKFQRGFADIRRARLEGGVDGTPVQQLIYSQEEAAYDGYETVFGIGLGMCIPTVTSWGTDAQRQRYVARALMGQEIWCQLFSEPAGGSDVAALRTTAIRSGDGWIINGQKIWSSGAHYCDRALVLARTDSSVPKHKGLTMFIVDMKARGVETRPIRQLTGEADFNEVFFTDVNIPDEDRLGAVGEGWRVALTTLMHERLVTGSQIKHIGWAELIELARVRMIDARPALEDERIRERIVDSWINDFGRVLIGYRAQTALSRGGTPGPEQSLLKLLFSGTGQRAAYLAMDLMNEAGLLTHEDLGDEWREVEFSWAWGAAMRLAGGSDEILKNIIAERVLGLPQEPRLDKDVAFNASGVVQVTR